MPREQPASKYQDLPSASFNWGLAIFTAGLMVVAWGFLLMAVLAGPVAVAVPAQEIDDVRMVVRLGTTSAPNAYLRDDTLAVALHG